MVRKKTEYKFFARGYNHCFGFAIVDRLQRSFYCIPVLMSSAHFCWIGDLEFDEEAQISGAESHRRMRGEGQSVCQ